MKQIKLVIWFENSEVFISKLVAREGFKCSIRKIIDPIATIIGVGCLLGSEYVLSGKEEEINKIINFVNSNNYDIDVEEV